MKKESESKYITKKEANEMIENALYENVLLPFSETNQCNIGFELPDPLASFVGGFAWRDREVDIDIVDLVGTSQLSKLT